MMERERGKIGTPEDSQMFFFIKERSPQGSRVVMLIVTLIFVALTPFSQAWAWTKLNSGLEQIRKIELSDLNVTQW